VTIDYHKTWFQPVSASALVVRDRSHLRHVTWHADYLNPKDAAHPNQVDKSLQTTRRFDALKLWLTLRVMGPDRIGEYVDTVVDLTSEVAQRLEHVPSIELAAPPQLSTLVFRYRRDGLSNEEIDLLAPLIRSALYERGTAMVAGTKVGGRPWLKLTLLNPLTTVADVLGILDEVTAVGDEAAREAAA
jgi:L-2,4-diaminobutyrate decarboxylase